MDTPRVTGSLLPNYIGQHVILLGKIERKSSDGRSAEIRTTDDAKVNITLSTPIENYDEGYVEVEGTLQSKTTLSCSRIYYFSKEDEEDFAPEQYNSMIDMYNLFAQRVWDCFNVEAKEEFE